MSWLGLGEQRLCVLCGKRQYFAAKEGRRRDLQPEDLGFRIWEQYWPKDHGLPKVTRLCQKENRSFLLSSCSPSSRQSFQIKCGPAFQISGNQPQAHQLAGSLLQEGGLLRTYLSAVSPFRGKPDSLGKEQPSKEASGTAALLSASAPFACGQPYRPYSLLRCWTAPTRPAGLPSARTLRGASRETGGRHAKEK